MVYVKLIRESFKKTVCETLNMRNGMESTEESDRIILSDNLYSNGGGYRVTKEDLEYLYQRKKQEAIAQSEKRKTAEQKLLEEKLKELAVLQEEKRKADKRFPRCVIKKFFGDKWQTPLFVVQW